MSLGKHADDAQSVLSLQLPPVQDAETASHVAGGAHSHSSQPLRWRWTQFSGHAKQVVRSGQDSQRSPVHTAAPNAQPESSKQGRESMIDTVSFGGSESIVSTFVRTVHADATSATMTIARITATSRRVIRQT